MRRAIVPLLAVTTACSLLTSFEGFDVPRGGGTEAGATEAGEAAAPTGPCFHKRWPAPPQAGAATDIGEIVMAVRTFGLISTDPATPHGFDLDNLCTCAEKAACVGAQPNRPCDPADSGIDNATDSLFSLFSLVTDAGLDESGLENGLARGRFGLVFKISGWNGEADDPEVLVSMLNAVEVNPEEDGGARFDGKDLWVPDVTSTLDGKIPSFFTRSAYVSGGVLVASFPRLVAKIRIPTFNDVWLLIPVEISNAQITGRLRRTGATAELTTGELGGRVATRALFSLAASAGACGGTDTYRAIKATICDARDLPSDPSLDGRDSPCDSLSIGMAFDAIPARVTAEAGAVVDPTPCADAAPDDCR
ncbi:MAG: hypothetical protein JST00_32295 [Deltaproteobacteria bacterium]|nr:hypothetical protein [Deltaproteobacteria bacterium]